jgi:drug/metabolite transporter (DMT)-like permease
VPSVALALVLLAAFLHLAWNTLVKRATDPFLFLWSTMLVAGLLFLPLAIALETLEAMLAVWPLLLATSIIHSIYFVTLTRAYSEGDLSIVYPIARGLGIGLVPIAAFFVFGEVPSWLGAIGLALVLGGVVLVGLGAPKTGDGKKRGVFWAIATGLLVTAYSMVDRATAREVNPISLVVCMNLFALSFLIPVVVRRRKDLAREWRVNAKTIVVASLFSLTGYALVLFAFREAKTGYVVASREISIVLSTAVGGLWLGEKVTPPRVIGALLVVAGITCIAFAT